MSRGTGATSYGRVKLRREWVWGLGNTAFVTLTWVVALLVDPEFFYFDDTPGGAVGQWYELGQHLWTGRIPFLNAEAWMAGNYTMEQWGLFNPPILLVALLSVGAADLLVFASVVKLVFLLIGALGVQYLARVVRIPPAWAAIAGASSAVTGFTFFIDATTWVPQLMVWAWFSWALAGLIRWSKEQRNLLLALIAGWFVITVGYVHGTLFLVMAFIALLVDGVVARDTGRLLRTLGAGVVLGLVALGTYLPAVIGSPLTLRATTVDNDGFMSLTWNGLLVAATPMASPNVLGWWGSYAHSPITYIAWFLPLVILARVSVVADVLRDQVTLVVLGLLVLGLATGPSQLAMFRYPVRAMPWLALVTIVLTCKVLSTVRPSLPSWKPAVAASLTAAGYYLAWSGIPEQARWLIPFGLLVTAAVWAIGTIASGRGPRLLRRFGVAGLVALVTLPLVMAQVVGVGRRDPGFGRFGFPHDREAIQSVLPGGQGNALVIGDPWVMSPSPAWGETSVGNLWYVVDHADVMNLYSPSGFAAFNQDLCMDPYYGRTCQGLLDKIFTKDSATGVLLADLLSLDTVQVVADEERPAYTLRSLKPPPGWVERHRSAQTLTWVRDQEPVDTTMDAWASPEIVGSVVSGDDNSFAYRVDAVNAQGGRIVLPRLAWPGYSVKGAALGEPVRGYLLTVDVPPDAAGRTVTVTFSPPGSNVTRGAMFVALLLGAGMWFADRLRRRKAGDNESGQEAKR